jgi:8-oxo-dGTP diphosphatase
VKRIHVAAAVIRGANGRILIARRPEDKHQGGLWEFPGGKVEAGEAVEVALARELDEELGIRPTLARPLIQVRHDYPDKQVLLDVWEVSAFSGEPHGAEGQPLAWVSSAELADYQFPAANRPIVAAAQLPDCYLITPDNLSAAQLLQGIEQALNQGVKLLQLRAPQLSAGQYRALAAEALELCSGRARLLLKGPVHGWVDFPEAGWHLSAQQLRELAPAGRSALAPGWLAASCHCPEELAMATVLGVDFVTLSPICATATHPEAVPLGWERAAQWLQGFNQPAYLLGGLAPGDLHQAWQSGAQGVAGIRGLWPA